MCFVGSNVSIFGFFLAVTLVEGWWGVYFGLVKPRALLLSGSLAVFSSGIFYFSFNHRTQSLQPNEDLCPFYLLTSLITSILSNSNAASTQLLLLLSPHKLNKSLSNSTDSASQTLHYLSCCSLAKPTACLLA